MTRRALSAAVTIAALTILATRTPAAAQPASAWDDPRLTAWSKDYLAGHRDDVLRSVEKDLRGHSPHPFARWVWLKTLLVEPEDLVAEVDRRAPDLKATLGETARAFAGYQLGRCAAVLDLVPPAQATRIADEPTLWHGMWCAEGLSRYRDKLRYVDALAAMRPDMFLTAWEYADLGILELGGDELARSRILESADGKGRLAGKPTGVYVLDTVSKRRYEALDRLAAQQHAYPGAVRDHWALRHQGFALEDLGRYEHAAQAFAEADGVFPFGRDGSEAARCWLKAGNERAAIAHIERMLTPAGHPADVERRIRETRLVSMYKDAGERGRAREVLAAALKRWPDDPELSARLYELERDAGRAAFALSAARTYAAKRPARLAARLELLRALRAAGRPEEAYDEYVRLTRELGSIPFTVYSEGGAALRTLQRRPEALALFTEAAAKLPESTVMQRDLAQSLDETGATAQAIAQLDRVIALAPPQRWDVDRLVEWTEHTSDAAAADRALARLRDAYPWVAVVCEKQSARLESRGAVDERIALWKDAIARAPDAYWPREGLAIVYHDAERWQDAEQVVRRLMADAGTMSPDGQARVHLTLAWTATRRAARTTVPAPLVEEALAGMERFKAAGGWEGRYHSYRADLLRAVGRRDEATDAALARVRVDPSNGDAVLWLFNHGTSRASSDKWIMLSRFMDLDPYDGARLRLTQKMHVLYGGSAIVGLRIAMLMRERAPSLESDEAAAYGKLGDAAQHFGLAYSRASDISPSDRYVAWYDGARRAAQRESVDVGVPFDPASQARCPIDFARSWVSRGSTTWAVLCHHDGTVVVREDDPRTGKLRLLRHGAAFIRYTYDDVSMNLRRVESSSKRSIDIKYDGRQRITSLRPSWAREVRFTFNDRDKPVRIEVVGLGALDVTYDPDSGDIKKVDSSQGRDVATEVTTTFQGLLDLVQPADHNAQEVPDLDHDDPIGDRLSTKLAASDGFDSREGTERALVLARHLVKNVQDEQGHAERADRLLVTAFRHAEASADDWRRKSGVDAFRLWFQLKRATRPAGLSADELHFLVRGRTWLEDLSTKPDGRDAAALVRDLTRSPLGLMNSARWLPTSDLSTPGPWRRHPTSHVLPRPVRGATIRTVLARVNGDVVVGSSAGLHVLHRGYWQWYTFDRARSRFTPTADPPVLDASSDVLALAEDDDGVLWIGTATGLIALPAEIDGEASVWQTPDQGLPQRRVDVLAPYGGGVLIGTAGGARIFTRAGLASTPAALAETPIIAASSARAFDDDVPLLVTTSSGLYASRGDDFLELVHEPVVSAVYVPGDDRIIYQRGSALHALPWRHGDPGPSTPLPDQQAIVKDARIEGLCLLPLDREGNLGVAALTDQGLSVFRDEHFEHIDVKDADRRLGVKACSSSPRRADLVTTDGVLSLEVGQTHVHPGRVYDLLTVPEVGATFVAHEGGLSAIKHGDPTLTMRWVDEIDVTVLARHPEGGFIANDGTRIVHYNPNVGPPQDLFDATPSESPPPNDGLWETTPVRSILASRDGAIWVVSGSYTYRFKDGVKQEFSTQLDPDAFPLRTEKVSRVIETVDGKIWVIGSDESHLTHRGLVLGGGVVEWTGIGFRRLDLDNRSGWFIRSYTVIDDHTAIAGTTSGFARHRHGRYGLLAEQNVPSYDRMRARNPQLFLGTRGARLGSLWLFGTAGGVVAMKDGEWFIPDRLNWMLPAQSKANLGSRHVHAVETDPRGRVFVGTDAGLLVYDSGGGDPAAFLLSNGLEMEAFADAGAAQLAREGDVLLSNVKSSTPMWERIQRVDAIRKEVAILEAKVGPGAMPMPALPTLSSSGDGTTAKPPAAADVKRSEDLLRERNKALAELLLRIEREDPGLAQLVGVNPIDLASTRHKLEEGQVIVQYLPMDQRLYVQVVSREGQEVREVEVPRAELLDRARVTAARLGIHTSPTLRQQVLQASATAGAKPIDEELAWLYDQLLRPIEGELAGKSSVYIVPMDGLTYLPFGALIRTRGPEPEYAVQRYQLGYLTSLYMFELMLRNVPSDLDASLVIGDPDGSLNGARKEAEAVAGTLPGATLHLGDTATYEVVVAEGKRSKTLHFATHGILDHERPERSALLLANQVRLTVPDAMTLDLEHTDLVVLSACESGIGRTGLEYATLARAFMHAGVSTVVATLWQVDDDASQAMMREFYGGLKAGKGRIEALTAAQRSLLQSKTPALRAPSAWASYIAFGRP